MRILGVVCALELYFTLKDNICTPVLCVGALRVPVTNSAEIPYLDCNQNISSTIYLMGFLRPDSESS